MTNQADPNPSRLNSTKWNSAMRVGLVVLGSCLAPSLKISWWALLRGINNCDPLGTEVGQRRMS